MGTLYLDYSKPTNWKVEDLKMRGVNIRAAWDHGRLQAENAFVEDNETDVLDMMQGNVSMLKPFGKKVGVNSLDIDWSEDVTCAIINDGNSVETTEVETVVPVPSYSIADYLEPPSEAKKHDNQIEIDGVYHYKASVVSQLFDQSSGSNDRLKRVQSILCL